MAKSPFETGLQRLLFGGIVALTFIALLFALWLWQSVPPKSAGVGIAENSSVNAAAVSPDNRDSARAGDEPLQPN